MNMPTMVVQSAFLAFLAGFGNQNREDSVGPYKVK